MLIPWNLFPGVNTPSGYLNFSIEKDISIIYNTKSNPVPISGEYEIVLSASALNFIMFDRANHNNINLMYNL